MSHRILKTVSRLSVVGIAFALLLTELSAQQGKPRWAQRESVRDSSDTAHLNFRMLRTWTQTDVELLPEGRVLTPEFKTLWKSVLNSKDRELRRNAVLSIGQAHDGGFDDFSDLIEDVRATFNRDDLRPITRVDAARTLVILDARAAAPDLMKHLNEPGVRQVAEPAFARWDHEPARAMWMERLKKPEGVPRSHLAMAMQCLAQVKHSSATNDCRKIAFSPDFDAGLRMEAARALARLQPSGLENDSENLLAGGKSLSALLGATLLREHTGETTERLLTSLLEHSSPPVAAKAWERLNELNPDRVTKAVLKKTLGVRDARLRLLAVRNCKLRSELLVDWLMAALDDHHPDVRCLARHGLRDHERKATKENKADIVDQIHAVNSKAFTSDFSWRGLEQACLLAGEIDHEPAVNRIVALLRHERKELASAAAYSLKELAVADVLPQMLAYAEQLDGELSRGIPGRSQRAEVVQTHLFESFADLNYRPADSLMRKYVPKQDPRYDAWYTRMAAIWSLAHFNKENSDAQLLSQFKSRMLDWSSIPPEMNEVVMAAALAFGVMKQESAVADLRRLAEAMPNQPPGRAAHWSIHQITGEPIPPKPRLEKSRSRWFLAPMQKTR
ncbi:MAG: hypothetical protein H8E37_04235 [Planctomycetes bacterium]|nr:hypothetical protein [Planctomycetota bacterium]